MNKENLLQTLKIKMINDRSLPLQESNLVFGEGSSEADIFFIGEAPGKKEDEEGRPFIGRSGQLLTKILEDTGIKRSDVYISNIVKRRPPDNRDPSSAEIESYKPYLQEQIEIINPILIVPLGRLALNFFIPTGKISRDQGKVFSLDNRFIVPIFHPSAALRGTKTLNIFKKSIYRLPNILQKIKEN